MTKEAFITLWNARNWENHSYGVYFISKQKTRELNFSFTGYSEGDLEELSNPFMLRLSEELEKLDQQAHAIIQKEYPGEDASELDLTDLMFDKSGCYGKFALGYDAGESPAGLLYILVKFDEQLHPDPELIYETY